MAGYLEVLAAQVESSGKPVVHHMALLMKVALRIVVDRTETKVGQGPVGVGLKTGRSLIVKLLGVRTDPDCNSEEVQADHSAAAAVVAAMVVVGWNNKVETSY